MASTHPELQPGEEFLGIAKDPAAEELVSGGTTVEMYGDNTRCGMHAYDSEGKTIPNWVPVFHMSPAP